MHDVTLDGRPKKVAATCDELSREQLLRLMGIIYGAYPDPHRQRIEALQVLLGISPALALRITPVQWLEIFCLADFLLGEQLDFTKQLLPKLRLPWSVDRYYGPVSSLSNVRFLEFVFADAYFVAYARTQDVQWRHFLLAVLYRPQRRHYQPTAASYAGDRRADFNENLLGPRAEALARLPEAEQLAIVTWYRGCRAALEQRYPLVFTPAAQTQAEAHPDGWGHVLREMSGQAFGSFEETGRQHLHTVLAKLQDDLARAAQLHREAEQQKNSY
jgi:hypothetical protein